MKLSGGVEWALHCCVVLTAASRPVPAARLAELHDVSPSYLAKQMQALSRAGLVRSVQGKTGGYVLTRPAVEGPVTQIRLAMPRSMPWDSARAGNSGAGCRVQAIRGREPSAATRGSAGGGVSTTRG